MRQSMNEQIEDERGLLSKTDFKKMLFTSFGRIPEVNKQIVYDMLLTIISADAISLTEEEKRCHKDNHYHMTD
jgi:hypothetical protein